MKKIIIINFNTNSPGVSVIVDELYKVLREKDFLVKIVNQLPAKEEADGAVLIPYGPKETYLLLKAGLHCDLSLMVDYYSMGLKNKFLFYLKKGKIWYKDFWRSMLAYFLYYFREKYIFSHVENFMFVSQYDIVEVKKRFSENKYFFVPNGVNLPTQFEEKSKSDRVRLGILSNWNKVTLSECKWFIESSLKEIERSFNNIELVVAGKGATSSIVKYFSANPKVRFIGKVENLNDFFNNIDIYVATVPRGCGILNKVLDAFAHKTLVIGIEQSFSAFRDLSHGYIVCDRNTDYIDAIYAYNDSLRGDNDYIENAYRYIGEHNQWDENYRKFVDELIELKII